VWFELDMQMPPREADFIMFDFDDFDLSDLDQLGSEERHRSTNASDGWTVHLRSHLRTLAGAAGS
jgi:hypothetical protein